MSCPCDQFVFPPARDIQAGLTQMPRQTGTFAEFRRALLRAASIRSTAQLALQPLWAGRFLTEPDRNGLRRSLDAIGTWRGRHPEDFAIMLLEMWAYVCDLTSFYDDVLAHECYVRTARRRASLRKLVGLLGYLPRPAVAALADLAAFAEGRQAVSLPVGTAFRSGAFDGNPPEVFELDSATTIQPLLNEWALLPVRNLTFGAADRFYRTLLCELGSVSVKQDDLVLVKVGSTRYALTVQSVANQLGVDGETYVAVTFSSSVWMPGGTPVSSVQLLKPGVTAGVWTRTAGGFGPLYASEVATEPYATRLYLDSISPTLRTGQDVIVSKAGTDWGSGVFALKLASKEVVAATTIETKDGSNVVIARTPMPAIYERVTEIDIQPYFPGVVLPSTSVEEAADIRVHHAFTSGGKVTIEALPEVASGDPHRVDVPLERPRDGSAPGIFELEDKDGLGLKRPGSLNFADGEFTVQGDPWPQTLLTPVRLFGNVIGTSRGETVRGEWLGTGDASVANQHFKLKKSPLTYLPAPSENTPSGLTSTLRVYVEGLQWTEVPGSFGAAGEAEVYTVRQNDKDESIITFGDGVRGRRLETGAQVVAYYRFGGGGAMPPAGSITQVARPVRGLRTVRNPVAAYGGAEPEAAANLRAFAPRSALLLGRAVSLPDLEAAAASFAGVRAVAAEWRWSEERQVPAAHIWYLADGDLTELLTQHLRALTQPDFPLRVERARPARRLLQVQIATDPKRFEVEVLGAVRLALMDTAEGLLPPERLGIGKPLFRSRLFDFVTQVAGAESVVGLNLDERPFAEYGVKPEAGYYFDFSSSLILNGRTE